MAKVRNEEVGEEEPKKKRPNQGKINSTRDLLKMRARPTQRGPYGPNGKRTLRQRDMPVEIDPRFLKFKELFMKGLTLEEAADATGYEYETARTLARRIGTNLERELRRKGFTEEKIAQKLMDLIEAKTVKWNPAKEEFETFNDGRLQLDALLESAAFLGIQGKSGSGGGPINIDKAILVVSNVPRPQRQLPEMTDEPTDYPTV